MKESPYFFVLFDESLNVCSEFSKWISSDIGVREKIQIEKRYFDLKFLGHTTSFNHVIEKMCKKYIIQISMDDPTTTWRFYNLYIVMDFFSCDWTYNLLLNTGSCSLPETLIKVTLLHDKCYQMLPKHPIESVVHLCAEHKVLTGM